MPGPHESMGPANPPLSESQELANNLRGTEQIIGVNLDNLRQQIWDHNSAVLTGAWAGLETLKSKVKRSIGAKVKTTHAPIEDMQADVLQHVTGLTSEVMQQGGQLGIGTPVPGGQIAFNPPASPPITNADPSAITPPPDAYWPEWDWVFRGKVPSSLDNASPYCQWGAELDPDKSLMSIAVNGGCDNWFIGSSVPKPWSWERNIRGIWGAVFMPGYKCGTGCTCSPSAYCYNAYVVWKRTDGSCFIDTFWSHPNEVDDTLTLGESVGMSTSAAKQYANVLSCPFGTVQPTQTTCQDTTTTVTITNTVTVTVTVCPTVTPPTDCEHVALCQPIPPELWSELHAAAGPQSNGDVGTLASWFGDLSYVLTATSLKQLAEGSAKYLPTDLGPQGPSQ